MGAALEFRTAVLELDDKFQERVNNLQQDGWMIMPGTQPVAFYQLCRQLERPAAAGFATLQIDESKIGILRNGKMVQN